MTPVASRGRGLDLAAVDPGARRKVDDAYLDDALGALAQEPGPRRRLERPRAPLRCRCLPAGRVGGPTCWKCGRLP